MSAISKLVKAVFLITVLSAGSATAGQGGCISMPFKMPMMQATSGGNSEANQGSQQSCAVDEIKVNQEVGGNSNSLDLRSKMGNLATGGMNIAMTVIGAVFRTQPK